MRKWPASVCLRADADSWLPISGGALTGPLALPCNPTLALHAAPNSQVVSALPLAGGTLTGALGTSVEVFTDGSRWISVCSGAQIAA